MATIPTEQPTRDAAPRVPSVLVVVVVRDHIPLLGECLRSIAEQTHPRLAVVAVHNGGLEDRRQALERARGEGRVLLDPTDGGVAGAARLVRELPAVGGADHVLFVHDDTALAPDAVARLVEAAELPGVDRIGVVGPKIVDWDDPRVLREVGAAVDGFGHRYVALQDGERDQGQFDRVLEVLAVPTCAMLVSRDALLTVEPFDARLEGHQDDVDYCWRARIAGFRILMTPLAQARHQGQPGRGERPEQRWRHGARYYAERSALATMLRNHGGARLAVYLPLYLGYVAFLAISNGITRRFEDLADLVAALSWNLRHLPGTLRLRRHTQRSRVAKDASVARFIGSPFQFSRWFERAESLLEEQLVEEVEPGPPRSLRERAVGAAVGHPVLLAASLGAIVAWIGTRSIRDAAILTGGALAAFPTNAAGFLAEFLAPVRTTILGGGDPASPALLGLGGLSWLTFASGPLAQRLLFTVLVPAAGVTAHRAFRRHGVGPTSAVAAAIAYALSGTILWSLSEGRLPLLVLAVALPILWDRLETLALGVPENRAIVGLGMVLAIAMSVLPGALLPFLVLVAVRFASDRSALRLLRGVGLAVLAGLVLAFPVVVGTTDLGALVRFVAGGGPGTGWTAAYLPVTAILAYALAREEASERTARALTALLLGVLLAFASSARILPTPIAHAPAYLVLAAFSAATLVAFGLRSVAADVAHRGFGLRQVVFATTIGVLGIGIVAQSLSFTIGGWEIGRDRRPAAWPLVSSESGSFRILWLGRASAERFPAPGGDPQGVLSSGGIDVRWAITDRDGVTAVDLGRGVHGPGYDALEGAIREVLSGESRHVGALLAPLSVRFILAAEGDLPAPLVTRLAAQIDVDRVAAGGLEIYRNARALPIASVIADPSFRAAAADGP
ncbi:MAG: glycosyltransferase family 2 protein, partial [Actinomycetota bacterium]